MLSFGQGMGECGGKSMISWVKMQGINLCVPTNCQHRADVTEGRVQDGSLLWQWGFNKAGDYMMGDTC